MTVWCKAALVAIIPCLLAGCATDRSVGLAQSVEVAELSALPAPSDAGYYTIGAQESLVVTVTEAPALSGTYVTDRQGVIDFPLAGAIDLSGLEPGDAAKAIADRLRGTYVRDPNVRVRLETPLVASVSVGGEVENPGTYPARTSATLLRAVNNAGGLSEYAKKDDVLIMRTVGGQRYIGVYNIGAIQRGNYEDPVVYPDDIVTVGDSPARRRLEAFLQFVPLLSTAAILIERSGQ